MKTGSYKSIFKIIIFGIIFITYSSLSYAIGKLSPLFINGTVKVNAEKLIELVGKTDDLIIIDSRIKSDRQQGYIESSLSLPDSETSCATLSEILTHKKSPVVFYCNGPKCGRSAVAVKVAVLCGYTNTFWFRGGFEEWKQKKYPFIKN